MTILLPNVMCNLGLFQTMSSLWFIMFLFWEHSLTFCPTFETYFLLIASTVFLLFMLHLPPCYFIFLLTYCKHSSIWIIVYNYCPMFVVFNLIFLATVTLYWLTEFMLNFRMIWYLDLDQTKRYSSLNEPPILGIS